jgi:hypothetical protein
MKNNSVHFCLWVLPVLFIFFQGLPAQSEENGIFQKVKNTTESFDDEKMVDAVLLLTDKTVLVSAKYQGGLFWTETRKDKMSRFKCNQCHNKKEATSVKAAEVAHGNISVVHGGEDGPSACFTCHEQDDRDFLVNRDGLRLDMDHSYQMCGQCHFRQKQDWVGGAHGKRVSYWAGKRVVKNCTSCHNPHSPRFEKRWPQVYSPPFKK